VPLTDWTSRYEELRRQSQQFCRTISAGRALAAILQQGVTAWISEAINDTPSEPLGTKSLTLATGADPGLSVTPSSDQLTRLLVEMAFHCSQEVRA
jgi:hypothetical protein